MDRSFCQISMLFRSHFFRISTPTSRCFRHITYSHHWFREDFMIWTKPPWSCSQPLIFSVPKILPEGADDLMEGVEVWWKKTRVIQAIRSPFGRNKPILRGLTVVIKHLLNGGWPSKYSESTHLPSKGPLLLMSFEGCRNVRFLFLADDLLYNCCGKGLVGNKRLQRDACWCCPGGLVGIS